jgi:spore germination protein KA
MVLLGPVSLWSFLQASEDYYQNYLASSMIRYLRYIFAHIALYTPALYIAVTTYHQDMLPTPLMLSIAAAREAIPFPALIEALIMEVSFEALREAGIRLPKIVGQAVSILGALVIGQAAVQAGIVSAPVVIIVSLTGIASFTIPRFNFAVAIRLLRFPFMVAAALFGVLGIIIGTMLILIHLCQVRSYGVPYLTGIAPIKPNQLKDLLFRVPWWAMKRRPEASADKVGGRRLNLDKPETGGTE